jgi:hypothetical protein
MAKKLRIVRGQFFHSLQVRKYFARIITLLLVGSLLIPYLHEPEPVDASSLTTFSDIVVTSQSYLENTMGELSCSFKVFQHEFEGSYRIDLIGTDIAPVWLKYTFAGAMTLPPDYKTGTFTVPLPPNSAGTYNYDVRIVYRPDYYGIFYDINSATDIVIDNITAQVTWIPQTAPLVLEGNDLPAIVRGYLSNDGFLQREVVTGVNEEGLTNIGGPNLMITISDGPYEVGVEYPMTISFTPTLTQGWSNSAGSAIVGDVTGKEMSSLHVFFDDGRQKIINPQFHFEGKTELGETIHDSISLAFVIAGVGITDLYNYLLDTITYIIAEAYAHVLASTLLTYFEPTQNIQYVDHSAHGPVDADNPAYFGIVIGDGSGGYNDIANVQSFEFTYNIKFTEEGSHEIIIAPNLLTGVKYTFLNNPITSDINTRFEYRDDIILRFDVIDSNATPLLSNPLITPSNCGDIFTNFTYQITYTDNENDAPNSAYVIIDSTAYALTTSDSYYQDGAQFTSAPRSFGTGVHSYYFSFTQGSNTLTTSPLNFYVYPSVVGHDLKLTTLSINKASAEQGDTITLGGQINNTGSYTENSISVDTLVTGPGSYLWTNTRNIGNLAPGGIWGVSNIVNWSIPSAAVDGEYLIRVTVNTPGGDQNWSDNTQTKSVFVSDEVPLAYRTYQYQLKQLDWTWNCTAPGFESWGCYGPGSVTNPGGDTYNVWVTDTGSNEWSFFIRNVTDNSTLIDFFDDAISRYETWYTDSNNLLYSSPTVVSTEHYVYIKLGYPQPSASISPLVQSSAVGVKVTYSIYIPCSTCGYSGSYVYEAKEGTDPPVEFFSSGDVWAGSYDRSGSGPNFTLNIAPYEEGVRNFAFDTRKNDLTSQNFIVYGKIEGYVPVDNVPSVSITSPVSNQTIFGLPTITTTAIDDKGINRVEFVVDGSIKATDTTSPYSFSWDTTVVGDGLHTITATAYDTKPQSSSHTINVSVDNNAPSITGLTHSPASPSNIDVVTIRATITDTSGISAASLKYSHDGGDSWIALALIDQGSNTWLAILPAMDKDDVLYKVEATDTLTRTSVSPNGNYHVSDGTPPTFYSWILTPSNLTEDHSGYFRVSVRLKDLGGSGLTASPPGIDYRMGSDSFDGFEAMNSSGGDGWYFDIPLQDWNSLRGQILYYKTQATDVDGNVGSVERSELIDSINDAPFISSSIPVGQLIDLVPGTCRDFQIITSDPENDPLSFSWVVDNNVISTSQSYHYCLPLGDDDEHTIVVVVSDASLQAIRSWAINQNQYNNKAFFPLLIRPSSIAQPDAFNKSLPENGSIDQLLALTLYWSESSNVTKYYYCYDKVNDGDCSDIWWDAGTNSSTNISGLDASAIYYWQVKATNSNPTATYANGGTWWMFTTQASTPPPGEFAKMAPADDATDQPLSLSLDWSSSSGATAYEYCVDSTINGSCNDAWNAVLPFSTSAAITLESSTSYEWQVRASNINPTATYADGGAWLTFTTQASSTNLYSYFPFDDKNDSLGYAVTGERGSISYSAGFLGNALQIPTDGGNVSVFLGSSITDPDTYYRDFMYENQSINVWINISEFNSQAENSMDIISGHPADGVSCAGIGHWVLYVGGVSDAGGRLGNEKIAFYNLSYNSSGEEDGNYVFLESPTGLLNVDQWYMITVTHDSLDHDWKLYLDGVQVDAETKTSGIGLGGMTFTCPYVIGNRPIEIDDWMHPFSGRIDELKFWHGVLSAPEVEQMYDNYISSPARKPMDFILEALRSLVWPRVN